jgi:hypothetical protein
MRRKIETVKGHRLPTPHLTGWGYLYVLLPVFVILAVLDALLYLIFRYGFDSCYGLWCLF